MANLDSLGTFANLGSFSYFGNFVYFDKLGISAISAVTVKPETSAFPAILVISAISATLAMSPVSAL